MGLVQGTSSDEASPAPLGHSYVLRLSYDLCAVAVSVTVAQGQERDSFMSMVPPAACCHTESDGVTGLSCLPLVSDCCWHFLEFSLKEKAQAQH